MKKTVSVIGIFVILMKMVWAQDIHFAQQFDNPIYLNPALSGTSDNDNRLLFQYRDQWRNVPSSFSTSFISFDKKLFSTSGQTFGGGIQLYYDKAGDGGLSTLKASISPSYNKYFKNRRYQLGIGFQLGVIQRAVNKNALVFESQYDGGLIGTSSGEALEGTAVAPDLGLGIHFGTKIGDKNHDVNAGFSVYNMHEPNLSLNNLGEDPRRTRYSAYIRSEIILNSGWSINPIFQFQAQEKILNILPILFAKKTIINEGRQDMAFSFGGGYRVEDAAMLYAAYEYGNFKLGFNYDMNTSSFTNATNSVGGFEVLLKYEFNRKKPTKTLLSDTLVLLDTVWLKEIIVDSVVSSLDDVVEMVDNVDEIISIPSQKEQTIDVISNIEIESMDAENIIDQINIGFAIKLFFPNDYPDPNSMAITTNQTYEMIYREYINMNLEHFKPNGQDGISTAFIEEQVIGEWRRFQSAMKEVRTLLREGKKVHIQIRGYTSPLAEADYNLNLSKRRVNSVINQLSVHERVDEYLNNGQLKVSELPLGEEKAPESVSDDRAQPVLSIFSDEASYERRVEIENIIVE